ncbi:SIS domain-containing protein [Candidatus Dependentiae bacterium]|nr:SIS domain-containing protein [Candidatus Dependentiae bacterium]
MLQELNQWPKKLKDGLDLAYNFHYRLGGQLPTNINKIAFVGMGGSGIAGRMVKTFLNKKSNIPSFVIDTPTVPEFIDGATLVFVISYSGNTWETIDILKKLTKQFIPTVVLSHGGKIAEIAEDKNLPFVLIPKSIQPRAALGNFLGFILGFLSILDLLPEGKDIVDTFVKQAELHIPKFDKGEAVFDDFLNIAKNYDFFHVWGVSGDTASFAYRAQTQFNENSKIQAVSSYFPECCHNLLNGFAKFNTKPLVLLFYTDFLTANLDRAIQATSELLEQEGVVLYKPPVLGDNWEGQLFYTILWSDFASMHLGKMRGVDVDRVEFIEKLKEKHKTKGIK